MKKNDNVNFLKENDEVEIVLFQLGDELYGADIGEVQEIIIKDDLKISPANSIGKKEDGIAGMFSLRNEAFILINLKVNLNIDLDDVSKKSKEKIILLKDDELVNEKKLDEQDKEMKMAMLCDDVNTIMTVKAENIQIPDFIGYSGSIIGIINADSDLITILDIKSIIKKNKKVKKNKEEKNEETKRLEH